MENKLEVKYSGQTYLIRVFSKNGNIIFVTAGSLSNLKRFEKDMNKADSYMYK